MSNTVWFKITFKPTIELAAESVARAGGRGTNDEIREFVVASTFSQKVNGNNTASYIAEMSEAGYEVADVTMATAQQPTLLRTWKVRTSAAGVELTINRGATIELGTSRDSFIFDLMRAAEGWNPPAEEKSATE